MNLLFRVFILLSLILVFPYYSYSSISFDANGKWETTFDYGPCASGSSWPLDSCGSYQDDGTRWTWSGGGDYGTFTHTNYEANYPGGGGGLGVRTWNYDGHNNQSGLVRVDFPEPQKEIWIRWYMRYQEGFQWRSSEGGTLHGINHNKSFLIRTGERGADIVPDLRNSFTFISQAHRENSGLGLPQGPDPDFRGGGWTDIWGPGHSDGNWYCLELYMKMNSEPMAEDGIARWWVNGVLMYQHSQQRFSNTETQNEGWTWFDFNNNQYSPSNEDGPIGLPYAYIDYDDMTIYNQTPPNTDEHGNPFIGPLPPAPPWGLSIDVQ